MPKDDKREFAPGIPLARTVQKLPTFKAPNVWEFGVHRHLADRAGEHFDLRLGDPSTGHAHSWALRSLPAPGERGMAVQQPTHTVPYMDFKGPIEAGYGKGRVELARRGQVEVIASSPDFVRFNSYQGKNIEEFALRRSKADHSQWMIQNVTPSRFAGPSQHLPASKPKYKTTTIEKLNLDDDNTELQAKIDGAHVLYQFKSPGTNTRVLSYRPTDRETGVIDHTHKLPEFHTLKSPAALKDTILRGELYAVDSSGKALPASRVGGILNSNVWKSREQQQQHGQLKPVVFDIVRFKGKDVENAPYEEKKLLLQKAVEAAPWLSLPRTATTPDEKKKLIEDIRSGKEPSTQEGVVEWKKDAPTPRKAKFLHEKDVFVRNVFPEAGAKRKGQMAGGFEFSYTPKGPIIGRVGTGMSFSMKKDLLQNPSKYEGLKARIKMQKAPEHHAPRAPVFHSFDLDQDVGEDVKTAHGLDKLAYRLADLEASNLKTHGPERGAAMNKAQRALGRKIWEQQYKHLGMSMPPSFMEPTTPVKTAAMGEYQQAPMQQEPPSKPKSKLPLLAGLTSAAVAAPLLYSAIRKPTYSKVKELADIQRRSGGSFARTIPEVAPTSRFRQAWDKVKYDADKLYYNQGPVPKKPEKFKGVVHHFDPGFDPDIVKGTVQPISNKASVDLGSRIGEHKWKEYQYFNKHAPGSIPESRNMKAVLREMGVRKVPNSPEEQAALLQKVQVKLRAEHPEGFVMKEVAGEQSAGLFPQETHELADLYSGFQKSKLPGQIKKFQTAEDMTGSAWDEAYKQMKADPNYSGRVLADLMRDPSSVMVQQKIPIEKVTGIRRLIGKALKQPSSKEIRVHSMGGVVSPEMAIPRYDPTMMLVERQKLRDAAAYAQSIVDKLPEKHRSTGFAMDIAPLEGGGFKLIESNPGGASGLLHPEKHPFISHIMRKQLTGQWSPNVAGAGTALGTTGIGLGTYGATGGFSKESETKGEYKGQSASPDTVKFKTEFQGIPIHVDRPKGFKMSGEDDKGNPWERKYQHDYGFIPKTLGGDGDGLDVFIGPDKAADESYWAVQNKPDGSFDEYKIFLGFPNRDAAMAAYRAHIPKKLLGGLITMKTDMMRAMLKLEPMSGLKKVATLISVLNELEKIAWWDRKKKKFKKKIKEWYPDEVVQAIKENLSARGLSHKVNDLAESVVDTGAELL